METNGGGRSTSSILKELNNTELNYEKIQVTTIDEYCKSNNIIPDGIKIDVEGAENLVIEGCNNIIKEYSPWIFLEFHSKYMNEEIKKDLWEKIAQSAKDIIFISGYPKELQYGRKINKLPDCQNFNILIKF